MSEQLNPYAKLGYPTNVADIEGINFIAQRDFNGDLDLALASALNSLEEVDGEEHIESLKAAHRWIQDGMELKE